MEELINTFLAPLLVALAGAVGTYISIKLNAFIVAKTGVQTTINLEKHAESAARMVEEYAIAKLKENTKLSSNEKLNLALAYINQLVPNINEEQAKALVLAAVNKLRCK
jgi:hypothetical protein